MLKITIKKRGKFFKLSNGEPIRTPRIIYKDPYDLPELTAIFRKLNLKEGIDFLIEDVSEEEMITKKESPQKFTRIRTGTTHIDLNNKIEPR